MSQIITFPKEFNYSIFRSLDKSTATITLLCYVLGFVFLGYMQTIPPKDLSDEQIARFQEVIYRVKPAEIPKVDRKTGGEATAKVEETVEEKPIVTEEKPQTEVAKADAREAARSQRQARQDQKMNRARQAAERVAVLAAPTARGGRRSAGGASEAAAALGLAAGGTRDVDISGVAGLVGDVETADKVKSLRGVGVISEGVGEIDISVLKTMSGDDLKLMFEEAPLQVSKEAITARGRASSARERSQAAISELVIQNQNQVQYCYWTLKRRDSSLRGRVVVEFVIEASGSISRVRFRSSEWGGNPLGKEVEKCIENVIGSWKFEPIANDAGSVTAGATYIFQ